MFLKKGLTNNGLKLLALLCMLIDHIAFLFVRYDSASGIAMHTIGRMAFPILAYMLVEGYFHTSSRFKYALRLLVFAVLSHFAFAFFSGYPLPTSVIYTMFSGFLLMLAFDYYDTWDLKIMSLLFLILCSALGDWGIYGALIILVFFFFHKKRNNQFIAFLILFILKITADLIFSPFSLPVLIMQTGIVLSVPVLYLYNGKKGGKRPGKYFFYLFYPLHLVLLKAISLLLGN